MPQSITCPGCSAALEIPEGAATLVQCPQCGATISLAGDVPVAAAPAPAPEVLDYAHRHQGTIVAKGAWDYRWRRLLLVLVLLFYGGWSLYDGFVRMPRENDAFKKAHPLAEKLPHPALDIPFNQYLGMALPPLSLFFLFWVLYSSRGEYSFDGTTLSVPGHPSVSIKAIRKIDRTAWDRKGIAYIHYQASGSAKLAVLKLDDFVYERKPTDEIFEWVASAVGPA
jgi:hypothetical protein